MPYKYLKKFKLSEKHGIVENFETNKKFVLSVPKVPGIYVVTANKELERVSGKSDILYIGRSGNLQRRMKYLLKYFLPEDFAGNWGKHTARKTLKKIVDETSIKASVQYLTCSNYKEVETTLLQKYCENHIETPPLNNQRK